MGQREIPLILLGLVTLTAALAGPSIAHRLLVPALGLVIGVRVWWPPAPAPAPERQRQAAGPHSAAQGAR
jgi:hypothetical protein